MPIRCASSTPATHIRRPSRIWIALATSGRTRIAIAPSIICSGPTDHIAPTWISSSPDAERGRRPSTRVCRPDARVVGIDVSPTSLDHTEQLKRKYNLTNLEMRQLPIESAAALGAQLRSDRVHGRAAPSRRSRCRPARASLGAETRGRDVPDGVCAVRQDRRLHAPGLLPETRHRDVRAGDQRSGRRC